MTPGIQSNHNSTYHIMNNLHCSDGSGQNHTSKNQVVFLSSIQSNHDSTYHIMDNLHCSDGPGKTILPKIKSFYFQASNLMKHIQKYAITRLTSSLTSIQAFRFTHSPHFKDNKYDSDSYLWVY
jgi:hypothetical protein